jgi:hypothetical protein
VWTYRCVESELVDDSTRQVFHRLRGGLRCDVLFQVGSTPGQAGAFNVKVEPAPAGTPENVPLRALDTKRLRSYGFAQGYLSRVCLRRRH